MPCKWVLSVFRLNFWLFIVALITRNINLTAENIFITAFTPMLRSYALWRSEWTNCFCFFRLVIQYMNLLIWLWFGLNLVVIRIAANLLLSGARIHAVLRLAWLIIGNVFINLLIFFLFARRNTRIFYSRWSFSLYSCTSGRNLRFILVILLIFICFPRIPPFRHLYFLLWLIPSKLLDPFLPLSFNILDLLLFYLLQIIGANRSIHFNLECYVFGHFFSHHRLRFLHSQKYTLLWFVYLWLLNWLLFAEFSPFFWGFISLLLFFLILYLSFILSLFLILFILIQILLMDISRLIRRFLSH